MPYVRHIKGNDICLKQGEKEFLSNSGIKKKINMDPRVGKNHVYLYKFGILSNAFQAKGCTVLLALTWKQSCFSSLHFQA